MRTVVLSCASLLAPAATALPINILPIGDSNTSMALWFDPLLSRLSAAGYSPTIIANEGHSGYIIDGSEPGAPRRGVQEIMPFVMNHSNVNADNTYILVMLGTNDVTERYKPETRIDRLKKLVSTATLAAPRSRVIVAGVLPIMYDTFNTDVKAFNAQIAATFTGPRMSTVDMFTAFPIDPSPIPTYMSDTLHAWNAGADAVADVWFNGIQNSTLYGDANFDGRVNALDFNALATGFGTNAHWEGGDFNYDGTVDTADFNMLATHFTSPALRSLVPEPAGAAGFVLLLRRRVVRKMEK